MMLRTLDKDSWIKESGQLSAFLPKFMEGKIIKQIMKFSTFIIV
jgi:hypothetical protein